MRAGRARHVEGGFHCGPRRGRETPAERNVKDKIKVKINGIKRRQVGESVERFSATFFDGLNERDNLVDRCFIQDAAWLPSRQRPIARQPYHLRRPPPRPSRSLHGSFSRRSTQLNLARFLSTIACYWQTRQTCPNSHHAKTPDRAQQRAQTRSRLCLTPRQLLTNGPPAREGVR